MWSRARFLRASFALSAATTAPFLTARAQADAAPQALALDDADMALILASMTDVVANLQDIRAADPTPKGRLTHNADGRSLLPP